MAKKKRSEIEEEENKKRSKIGAFLHKWRKWIVFGGIALGGVGLSFLTLGVSALLPALASIFSIVGIVTAAITALGVLLFGGNLLVNAVRFIFNIKNYRTNLLNARRERKAARERERETERERGREADNRGGQQEKWSEH